MLDCTLKQQADHLKHVAQLNQKNLAQRHQKAGNSNKSAEIWLNKLRPVPYSYMGAKPDDQKATPAQVYDLLRRRFGAEVSQDAARVTLKMRVQAPIEEERKYLDVLEALRSQAYPTKSTKDRKKRDSEEVHQWSKIC